MTPFSKMSKFETTGSTICRVCTRLEQVSKCIFFIFVFSDFVKPSNIWGKGVGGGWHV